ncbi:MAG: hypothetical protein PHV34_24585 [Verrucomicrobiae bacterium]|nr:hypothetical protein [Verrucomicrobiae bacterium]
MKIVINKTRQEQNRCVFVVFVLLMFLTGLPDDVNAACKEEKTDNGAIPFNTGKMWINYTAYVRQNVADEDCEETLTALYEFDTYGYWMQNIKTIVHTFTPDPNCPDETCPADYQETVDVGPEYAGEVKGLCNGRFIRCDRAVV